MQRIATGLLVMVFSVGLLAAEVIPPTSRTRAVRMEGWREALAEAERLLRAGDAGAAEDQYRGVIDASEASGEAGLLVARAVDGLADIYRQQERFDEARELYARSAAMWERLLGSRQPRLAVTLHNLALVEAARGERGDAERHLLRAIEIFEGSLGGDSAWAEASRERYAALREGSPDRP